MFLSSYWSTCLYCVPELAQDQQMQHAFANMHSYHSVLPPKESLLVHLVLKGLHNQKEIEMRVPWSHDPTEKIDFQDAPESFVQPSCWAKTRLQSQAGIVQEPRSYPVASWQSTRHEWSNGVGILSYDCGIQRGAYTEIPILLTTGIKVLFPTLYLNLYKT